MTKPQQTLCVRIVLGKALSMMNDKLKSYLDLHQPDLNGPPPIDTKNQYSCVDKLYLMEGEGEDHMFYVIGNPFLPMYLEDTVIYRHLDLSEFAMDLTKQCL